MDVSRIGSLLVAGLVTAVALAGGCGGENESSNSGSSAGSAGAPSGGSGGSSSGGTASGRGGSAGDAGAGSLTCGTASCEPLVVPLPGAPAIPACCPAGMPNTCGLDATIIGAFGLMFDEACQPREQPGALDPSCPRTDDIELPDAGLSGSFPGCCRPNGQCGYLADTLQLGPLPIALGLGCIDSAPFLDGGSPQSCGQGGAGGQAGAAGSPGAGGGAGEPGAGGAGAGGDTSSAGMGGG